MLDIQKGFSVIDGVLSGRDFSTAVGSFVPMGNTMHAKIDKELIAKF